ncbi:MAG: 3-deoxy-8-phosphooctulonate synthase [Bacteroidota bacterium]|nr:3-deoxy-8-phosphooctulonate synthase [Bacteroidota bacterium]
MDIFKNSISLAPNINLGGNKMILIAGPCVVESYELCLEVASIMKQICEELDVSYIFKASYDKANRTSSNSFRSLGMETGLEILKRIGEELKLPLITDVLVSEQVEEVALVVDVLQIAAFLCRQTVLFLAAGNSGKAVNIKRGQFMAPEDMKYAIEKIKSTGNENACLTERGVSFGYHNLVVDMRSLPIMRQFSPVIFDVTHSVQQPGGAGGTSGGQRQFAPYLARGAAAVGVDGFFVETHPKPSAALSDGPNMIPLNEMKSFVEMIKESWLLGRKFTNLLN